MDANELLAKFFSTENDTYLLITELIYDESGNPVKVIAYESINDLTAIGVYFQEIGGIINPLSPMELQLVNYMGNLTLDPTKYQLVGSTSKEELDHFLNTIKGTTLVDCYVADSDKLVCTGGDTLLTAEPSSILSLGYVDDGKQKWQSVEVGFNYKRIENRLSENYDKFHGISTIDLSCIMGYGETKEEALEEFTKQFDVFFSELSAFYQILHSKKDIEMEELGYGFTLLDDK